MKNTDIISLEETAPDLWQAKYEGNYGVYKIKIKLSGNKTEKFSCTCPSDGFPCKHIYIIEQAIAEEKSERKSGKKSEEASIAELLDKITHKELKDFIIRYSPHNIDFSNKLQLEFLHKVAGKNEGSYNDVLRKALKKVRFSYDDLYDYHDTSITIDVLDEWLSKAENCIGQNKKADAICIAKAIIEEFADWINDSDEDVADYLDNSYYETPFEILKKAVENDFDASGELFDYVIDEIEKEKYNNTMFPDSFHSLLLTLARTNEQGASFLYLQDKCLKKVSDKSSWEAQQILSRKEAFFQKINQPEKAWELISDNIQIEGFRKKLVEQNIKENKLDDAKKLINDFLKSNSRGRYYYNEWYELLLQIAQKEKDKKEIRRLAFLFIDESFEQKHYNIYKSTFAKEEWKQEMEKLIVLYQGKLKNYFSESVASVLVIENDEIRLMDYVEKHLSLERVKQYYSHFLKSYPEKTLELFQQAINNYAAANTGRSSYDFIIRCLCIMKTINGGDNAVNNMVAQFRTIYKGRRAMIEMLRDEKF